MDKYKLLEKIKDNLHNTSFDDFVRCIKKFGFTLDRKKGTSHIIFKKENILENINVQNYKGKAKPYQIKQFINIVKKYKL